MNRKIRGSILMLATLLVLGLGACEKKPVEQEAGNGLTEMDRKKLQALWERSQFEPTQQDLPVKYRDRAIPDKEAGELAYVYYDDELKGILTTKDLECTGENEITYLKGPKFRTSCRLEDILFAMVGARPVWAEFAGKGRSNFAYDVARMREDENGPELTGFVNKDGRLRVEQRPGKSLLSEEDIARGAKTLRREGRGKGTGAAGGMEAPAEQAASAGEGSGAGTGSGGGTGGGKGVGGKNAAKKPAKRGQMRGQLRMREVYWIDFHSSEFPESKIAQGQLGSALEGTAGDGATIVLSLVTPAGDRRSVTQAQLDTCPEEGCSLKDLLPERFKGQWCVASPTGTDRVDAAALRTWHIRARRQGGVVIKPPSGPGGEIRNPTSIVPCE
ncbi:MAG: hypothetical protein KDH09_17220 [Chrysiogenetes bacterium]|nr:hypothetical protein [Chrysiogenetes bacterium]